MYRCKHARKSTKKANVFKLTITLIALGLVFTMTLGGTIAWIVDTTETVKNTFTYGNIDITLTETDTGDGDNDALTNKYTMIPGNTIEKDPVVTVKANSEACWLFVKIEVSNNFDDFMEYAVASGWTQLKDANNADVTGVFFREVTKNTADQAFPVILDNKVNVKSDVTKGQLDELALPNATLPYMNLTAYAVQKVGTGDSAYTVWTTIVNPPVNP